MCFKSRRTPQAIILGLSVCTVIAAGLMIAFGSMFIYSELVDSLINDGFLEEQYPDLYEQYAD